MTALADESLQTRDLVTVTSVYRSNIELRGLSWGYAA